ncbi:hypothetical protein OHB49_41090 [Streptomyces sp. NBC_01717]|uniref:hypothetical protein n=1 Tax=Streptomyces sp. NBC_01717 TaxID=2975918 RepID=UPI002E34B120|nr:hypothetical protein [Streptomyces sp. NBC_01717]
MVKQRLVSMVLLSLSVGLVSGCLPSRDSQVTRSDLVGEWHSGAPCDSFLRLEDDGSARVSGWVTALNGEGDIAQRKNDTGTWSLETFQGEQYVEVKRGRTFEPLDLRRRDGRLVLLQMPGDDPDNSIGCRFGRVHESS